MNKSTFEKLVADPSVFTPRQKLDLQAEKEQYPYCAVLQLLDGLADKACGASHLSPRALSHIRLYVNDAAHLNHLLSEVRISSDAEPEATSEVAEKILSRPAEGSESEYDILREINAYQEVSYKTAPKSVILSEFLETVECEAADNDPVEPAMFDELAKKSIQSSGLEYTETLAVVFEKQGKYARAIEVYEKLMLQNPEKSSTFARRIEELKSKIN